MNKRGIGIVAIVIIVAAIAAVGGIAIYSTKPQLNPNIRVASNQTNQTTHLECINNTCTIVNGPGANQCPTSGAACGNQTNRIIWVSQVNGVVLDLDKVNDIDGDGIEEIAIPTGDTAEPGQLHLLSGANGNLIWSYTSQPNVVRIDYIATLQDINNDGYEDIAIGLGGGLGSGFQVISGKDGNLIWSFTAGQSARDVEAIMDVNGDGVNDVIGATAGSGSKVFAFDGVTGSLIWQSVSYPARDVEAIMDVNGDGVNDVLVGTQGLTQAFTRVLSGEDGSLIWSNGPDLGWYVKPIQEINGNGEDAIGATPETNTGLYRLNKEDGSIIWQFDGVCGGEWMGVAETINDINGDGIEDALTATTSVTPGSGCARRIYAVDGRNGQQIWNFIGSVPGSVPALVMIEDLNRNGIKEVLAVSENSAQCIDGTAYILEGSTGGLLWSNYMPACPLSGLSVKDLNGNGVADIIVGLDGIVYALEGDISASNSNQTTHLECINDTCAIVSGTGVNQCATPGPGVCGNQTNQTMPDLTILIFNNTAINQTNSTNYQITLTAVIKNIGNANAGASTTWFFVSPTGGEQLIATPSLFPGQQTNVIAIYSLTAGVYTSTANADHGNDVQESNENNNLASLIFTVP